MSRTGVGRTGVGPPPRGARARARARSVRRQRGPRRAARCGPRAAGAGAAGGRRLLYSAHATLEGSVLPPRAGAALTRIPFLPHVVFNKLLTTTVRLLLFSLGA